MGSKTYTAVGTVPKRISDKLVKDQLKNYCLSVSFLLDSDRSRRAKLMRRYSLLMRLRFRNNNSACRFHKIFCLIDFWEDKLLMSSFMIFRLVEKWSFSLCTELRFPLLEACLTNKVRISTIILCKIWKRENKKSTGISATLSLVSPILNFWGMTGFEPRVLSLQAGALPT